MAAPAAQAPGHANHCRSRVTMAVGVNMLFGVPPMRALAAPLLACAALAGCATPGQQRLAEQDPLERYNRAVWDMNMAIDKSVVKPTASAYRTVTPKAARRGISRILDNFDEPFSAINSLLQGRPDRAVRSLGRFVVNSTIGVGGLADHATGLGLPEESADFGQTMAVWGINAGPYVVLPLLGPSTFRDSVGIGVQFAFDPQNLVQRQVMSTPSRWSLRAFEAIDLRAKLMDMGADAVLETSADPYATARSAYLQRRAAIVAGVRQQAPSGVDPADFEGLGDTGATPAPADDTGEFDAIPDSYNQGTSPTGEAPPTPAP